MKKLFIALMFASSALLAQAGDNTGGEFLESYHAKLSEKDHFNSKGKRLKTVAAIIRQDRANYHKFHKRDAQDEWDGYFYDKANRAALENKVARLHFSKSTKNKIINGTPTVIVYVYENQIDIDVQ